MQEELCYANVKVLKQDITPEQAAWHIQSVHEKNAHLKSSPTWAQAARVGAEPTKGG